jgi:hypothetical protein
MENTFNLELKQNGEVIYSSIFNADCFSHKTLSAIDVRNVLSYIFRNLNNISSKRKFNTKILGYDLLKHYIKNYNEKNDYNKLAEPEIKSIEINTKVIKGVEMGLLFSINNKIIFDRTVFVDKYNPEFRFSNEINEFMTETKEILITEIKKSDCVNIYNENREYLNVN